MKFRVTEDIFTLFPEVKIGVIVAEGINNQIEKSEITDFLREQEATLPERFGDAPITEHPHIHPWREAYRAFGAKPKKYSSSIENLLRRCLKGTLLPNINPLVDLYNAVSLKHMLPIGGEDLDQMSGDLLLTRASSDEVPVKILGEAEDKAPNEGEVIYKDDHGTICRRWNWREADRTKLTENTTRAILVIEILPELNDEKLEAATEELMQLIQTHLGGTLRMEFLSQEKSEMAIS